MINKDKNLTNDTVTDESSSGNTTNKKLGKILNGIVVSDKQDKTVTVEVINFVKNPKYGKFVKNSKRYKAHDEKNQYKLGDKVGILEGRPISKDKTFTAVDKGEITLKNN